MNIVTCKRVALHLSLTACFVSLLPTVSVLAQDNSSRAEFPGRRVGGGTRGECVADSQPLVALNPTNNLGVTASETPTLYFLMPMLAEAKQVEFILRDSAANSVYQTTFDVGNADEIVSVSIPDGQLDVAKDYHWYFSILCEPGDRSQNIVVTGWLRRVSADVDPVPNAIDESGLDSILEHMTRYQEAGLWTDAIAVLVELHQTYPSNEQISAQWSDLLGSLELDAIVEPPLAAQF